MPSTTSKTKQRHSWQFEAIGTWWSIESAVPIDAVKDQISDHIDQFDKVYSRFRDDSLVSKISTNPGVYDFPPDATDLIRFYRDLYDATNGTVSPLVGDVLVAAGYDRQYSLQAGEVKRAPAWDDVMSWRGSEVVITSPLTLDLGAAGKGYLVDQIAEIIETNGITEYVIDASGDMRVRGAKQVVGLENPYDPESVIGTIAIQDASLCASATNRRSWGDWHHVIDPRTAVPVHDVVATWVVAPTTMVADGLATALFFASSDVLAKWDFTYVRLHADGHVERSDDFVGELYV